MNSNVLNVVTNLHKVIRYGDKKKEELIVEENWMKLIRDDRKIEYRTVNEF